MIVRGFFLWAERQIELEEIACRGIPALTIRCPVCEHRCRLNETRHRIEFNALGRLSISPSLLCPTPHCGWHVRVFDGLAIDVEEVDFGLPSVGEEAWALHGRPVKGRTVFWRRKQRAAV